MAYCTNCGEAYEEGVERCPGCGEPVQERSGAGRMASQLKSEPLPRDARNAILGIVVGILFFVGVEIGLVRWTVDFPRPGGVALVGGYIGAAAINLVVMVGIGYVFAKADPLFTGSGGGAGLSSQTKNAFLGVVVGHIILIVLALQSGQYIPASRASHPMFVSLASFVLVPLGAILCGYWFGKREVLSI